MEFVVIYNQMGKEPFYSLQKIEGKEVEKL